MSEPDFEKEARRLRIYLQHAIYGMRGDGSGNGEALLLMLDQTLEANMRKVYAKGAADEREACAKLVTSDKGEGDIDFIAALIRARGEK